LKRIIKFPITFDGIHFKFMKKKENYLVCWGIKTTFDGWVTRFAWKMTQNVHFT